MGERAFKEAYIAAFLGSYAALTYNANCQAGWVDNTQPVEDADELADEAWRQLEQVL